MAGNNSEEKRSSLVGRIVEGIFIAVVAGVLVYIITTGKIPLVPDWFGEKESWVKIQNVSITPSNHGDGSVVVNLDARYSLGQKNSALLMVMCNYEEEDSFTSMGLEGETIINYGEGTHSFQVSFIIPEWDDVAIRAYIHPYPLPDEWEPIAVSNSVDFSVENYR